MSAADRVRLVAPRLVVLGIAVVEPHRVQQHQRLVRELQDRHDRQVGRRHPACPRRPRRPTPAANADDRAADHGHEQHEPPAPRHREPLHRRIVHGFAPEHHPASYARWEGVPPTISNHRWAVPTLPAKR